MEYIKNVGKKSVVLIYSITVQLATINIHGSFATKIKQ